MAKYISWFRDIGLDDRPKVGGKGGSLGELQRAGIPVPPGFVVRTEAFERFLDALERRSPLRARVEELAAEDLPSIEAVSRELRARIEEAPLPADLQQEIREAYGRLGESGASPAGRGEIVGDHRRCRGCELRRPAGHLPVGHEADAVLAQDPQLLGQSVFRSSP